MSAQIEDRIYACWLGKSIGGTLGAPYEGAQGPLDLSFYNPVPANALPNDDLDLQLVWLYHLLSTGAKSVTPEVLATAWQRHVRFPFDEYGVCLRNLAYGLSGAEVGSYDNWFGECMGAAIRSEIWACLAPGEPERAAGFAWSDAVCDHSGDGVWAEVFLAALESAAFVEHDPERLLDGALLFLPHGSRVRDAICSTRRWWKECGDWHAVRTRIMSAHGHANFTDVAANLAFIILGWLAGRGDFGASICIAANCGQDTDCTAATLGALLGILNPNSIALCWKAPIGEGIVVSEPIIDIEKPDTLGQLTEQTRKLARQLSADRPLIGDVLARMPASVGPINLPATVSSSSVSLEESLPPPTDGWEQVRLHGHWMSQSPRAIRLPLWLDTPCDLRVMGWSQSRTAIWLDGTKLEPVGLGKNTGSVSAPSFHRGGMGHFCAPGVAAGEHALIIACELTDNQASELVVGVADADTCLWMDKALTLQSS